MEFTVQHAYKQDLETVLNYFFDAKELKKKLTSTGAIEIEIDRCQRDANEGEIVCRYLTEASENIPPALKSFANGPTALKQIETWHQKAGEWHGELVVELDGVPVKVAGNMRLYASESGCINEVTQTIHCPVPFLGKMIEEFISQDAQQQTEAEYQFSKASLE